MQVLQLIALLLLINAQVNSSPFLFQDKKVTTKRIQQWALDKAQMLMNEIQESSDNLKSTLEKPRTEGQLNMGTINTAQLHERNTRQPQISSHYYQQNVHQLELAKKSTFSEFLKCENLTDALHNIDQIIHETANLATLIIKYVEQGLSGLLECDFGNYFDGAQCVTDYIWNLINNLRKSVPQVKTYGDLMKELGDKIKAEIDYCMHPM